MPKGSQAVKRTVAAKPAFVRTSAAKAARERGQTVHTAQTIDPEDRYNMIAETAYYLAEQRGFEGDMADIDWLQAEAEVDARFAERH